MAETKLTHTKIPTRVPVAKPKKLGLLTPKKRKDITFRFKQQTLALLEDMVTLIRKEVNHKTSRTDLIEGLALWASKQDKETLGKILLDLGDAENNL